MYFHLLLLSIFKADACECREAHFPSIFDADSDDDSDPDEVCRKLNRDDTGPSLVPLNVSLACIPQLAVARGRHL